MHGTFGRSNRRSQWENKPKGLWCGNHNDRGRPTIRSVLMQKKFCYNESRRLK
nr:MAG TPA: hypothetical protein [Caudoviricetes sp.]